jgi:hypothetical protein
MSKEVGGKGKESVCPVGHKVELGVKTELRKKLVMSEWWLAGQYMT